MQLGIISSLLTQFVASHVTSNPHTRGPQCFEAYQFSDDGGIAQPVLGLRRWMSAGIWELGLIESLDCKSLIRAKKRVDGQYDTQSLMWGINVDKIKERVSLHAREILKAQMFYLPLYSKLE